jgi:hypothetical protein
MCPSGLKRVSLGHHDATAFDDSYYDSFLVTQNRTGSDRYPTNLSIDEDFCDAIIVCNRITVRFRGDTLVRRHKLGLIIDMGITLLILETCYCV